MTVSHPSKCLTFAFNASLHSPTRILEQGKLILVNENSKTAFAATSGLIGHQNYQAAIIKGKGRIPTCKQVNIRCYHVATVPVFLPKVKGVNGNFYPITPFLVEVGLHKRSDLGIHRDTNQPGSAGCIVLPLWDHWVIFEKEMELLRKQNIMSLPLFVE